MRAGMDGSCFPYHRSENVQFDGAPRRFSIQNSPRTPPLGEEVANPYLFSTKEFEPRSGLSDFGARYYEKPQAAQKVTPKS